MSLRTKPGHSTRGLGDLQAIPQATGGQDAPSQPRVALEIAVVRAFAWPGASLTAAVSVVSRARCTGRTDSPSTDAA
jgi:hypothetical protein